MNIREIKKTILFTIASKWIKYLGSNLTKEVKDLTLKTIRHWWSKLKKIQLNGKIVYVHGLEKVVLLNVHAILNNLQINVILLKIPMVFHRNKTNHHKILWNHTRPPNSQQSWERTNLEALCFLISNYIIKLYYLKDNHIGIKRSLKQNRELRNKPTYIINLCIRILFSHKKAWNLVICHDMDRPRRHYTKSDREKQVPYDLTYTWNLKANSYNRLVGFGWNGWERSEGKNLHL